MSNIQFPEYPNVQQLGGKIVDLIRFPDPKDTHWGASNPSIGHNGKSLYATTIRSSNYYIDNMGKYIPYFGDKFLSRVYFSEFDRDWKLKNLRRIDFDGLDVSFGRGVEDAKLFYRDGWYFTGVVLEREHTPSARMAIFKLDTKKNKVTSYTKLPGKDAKVPEKNWMVPYTPTEHFEWVYGPNQVLLGHTLNSWLTDNEQIHNLRGSSNLVDFDDETYLAVMHRTFYHGTSPYISSTFATVQSKLRDYIHYFVRFDKYGYIREMTPGFRFYKPGVEFAAGLTFKDNQAIVSFGRNDVSSHLAFLEKDFILKSLEPITY
jgi:hypothetical protein